MGVQNTRVCKTNKLYHQIQKITALSLHGKIRCNLDKMKEQYQKSYYHDYLKLNRKNAPVVGDDPEGVILGLAFCLLPPNTLHATILPAYL